MTRSENPRHLGKRTHGPLSVALLSVTALAGAALLTGCGGSSSGTGSTTSAQARVVNAIAGGGTATVHVNSNAIDSNLTSFGASSYQSVGDGQDTLTFILSAAPTATYPSVPQTLLDGGYYSFVLVGRADITAPADLRYPALIAITDTLTAPPSGDATLRVIDTAPDAGNVDVQVNSQIISSSAFYKSSSSTNLSAGTVTVQINQAGTSTALVASQSLNLSSGHNYTLFITEPTITPTPAYSVNLTDDTTAASQ